MGIRLRDITDLPAGLVDSGNKFLTTTVGNLTRLTSWSTFADWVLKTYAGFLQSGIGALSETTEAALRRLVHSAQFSTAGQYDTQKVTLTGTMALASPEVIVGGAVRMNFAAGQDTLYNVLGGTAGGAIKVWQQIYTDPTLDLILSVGGLADIHLGHLVGGTGVLFIDMDIKVATFNNGTRATGMRILQNDNTPVIEFPTSGAIMEVSGVFRGSNGANEDLLLRNGNSAGFLKFLNAANTLEVLTLSDTGELVVHDSIRAERFVAIPVGGTAGVGLMFSNTANFGIFFGSGLPSLSAAKGSLYLRSDGTTTNDRAYINTDGAGTWTALTTAA